MTTGETIALTRWTFVGKVMIRRCQIKIQEKKRMCASQEGGEQAGVLGIVVVDSCESHKRCGEVGGPRLEAQEISGIRRALPAAPTWFLLALHTMCLCLIIQPYLTLCNPLGCSPSGSSVYGIFQARILKWVAISSARASSQPRDQTHIFSISCIAGRFFTH